MVELTQGNGEEPLQIHDDLPFVEKEDVAPGDTHTPAYTIEGPLDHAIAIDAGTLLAPLFRDANGDPIDSSTHVTLQKADPQGNPIGNAIVFTDTMDVFEYSKMRSDSDYFVTTQRPVVLDEREYLYVYLDIPSGANGFDASNSRLAIGDRSTRKNQPAYIRDKRSLGDAQKQAVSQGAGGN